MKVFQKKIYVVLALDLAILPLRKKIVRFGHCNNFNSINELQISPRPAIHLKQDRLNVCIIGQSVTW